jgi:hypothetical protein
LSYPAADPISPRSFSTLIYPASFRVFRVRWCPYWLYRYLLLSIDDFILNPDYSFLPAACWCWCCRPPTRFPFLPFVLFCPFAHTWRWLLILSAIERLVSLFCWLLYSHACHYWCPAMPSSFISFLLSSSSPPDPLLLVVIIHFPHRLHWFRHYAFIIFIISSISFIYCWYHYYWRPPIRPLYRHIIHWRRPSYLHLHSMPLRQIFSVIFPLLILIIISITLWYSLRWHYWHYYSFMMRACARLPRHYL